MQNFTINGGNKSPNQLTTQQNSNNTINTITKPQSIKPLSQQEIAEINKKYGLPNFTIDVGIKSQQKKQKVI